MQRDPVGMIRDVIGSDLWADQQQIVESVRDNPKTAWRSCHGIGKTYVVARLVLWWLFAFEYSIVITTAPTWRQVQDLVWKELRSAYSRSKVDLGGNLAPSACSLQIDGLEWCAIGLSTNDSNRFQGYHAQHLLVIVDEGAGVAEDIYEAVDGVLTSAHCRLAVIGNPTDIGGQFYRAFREPGWNTGRTSAWDTPNFTTFGITREDIASGDWETKIPKKPDGDYDLPAPWLITPAWVADKYKRWGPHHPAYSARVEGQFPEQGEYNVIPLSWIEQAQDRWLDMEPDDRAPMVFGVDVARGGMDRSAIIPRLHNYVPWIKSYSGLDTQQLAGEVIQEYRIYKPKQANVDVIGLGSGVVDELKLHREINVSAVNVSLPSAVLDDDGHKKFANLRAEFWWALRESLDPKGDDPLALPPDDELLADLAAPQYDFSKGWIQIEPKELTKKRLGRSPDLGDALMLTFAPVESPVTSLSFVCATKPASRWVGTT